MVWQITSSLSSHLVPRHQSSARGLPDEAWRHGVHFAAFPASILRPLMFVYCPEYYSGILALRAHNLGIADTNITAIFLENSGIICIYAIIDVSL